MKGKKQSKAKSKNSTNNTGNEIVCGMPRHHWNVTVRTMFNRFFTKPASPEERRRLWDYDMTESLAQRRGTVILKTMQKTYNRYEQQFEEYYSPKEFGNDWITMNLQAVSLTSLNNQYHYLYGAAIWILDRITAKPGWEEKLMPLLPKTEELPPEGIPFYFRDAQYETELIERVVHVLRMRNHDISPAVFARHGIKELADELTAEKKNSGDVPSRRAFEGLLELIEPEDRENAAKKFDQYSQEWLDMSLGAVFQLHKDLKEDMDRLEKEDHLFSSRLDELVDSFRIFETGFQRRKKPSGEESAPCAVLSIDSAETGKTARTRPAFRGEAASSDSGIIRFLELNGKTGKMAMEEEAVLQRIRNFESTKTKLITDLFMSRIKSRKYYEDVYGEKVAGRIYDLRIPDPYEVCFGLLYRIDTGSDLPWLFGPTSGLCVQLGASLPWGYIRYRTNNPDPQRLQERAEEIEAAEKNPGMGDVLENAPGILREWNIGRYTSSDGKDSRVTPANILYTMCGCVMPRNPELMSAALLRYEGFGLSGEDRAILTALASALARPHRKSAVSVPEEIQPETSAENSPPETEKTDAVRPKENRSKSSPEEEIRKLREALEKAETAAREARKQLEISQKTAEAESRKLEKLREVLSGLADSGEK